MQIRLSNKAQKLLLEFRKKKQKENGGLIVSPTQLANMLLTERLRVELEANAQAHLNDE